MPAKDASRDPSRDIERFERVVLPHLDDAYTLARYLLRDQHEAQDAVQDAVLRALRYFETYRDGDARAWLLAIVRNCCLTRQRRAQVERANISFVEDIDVARDEGSRGTDARAIEQSERAALQRALAALPDEFREVIVLREVQGLSYREISDVVGVPIGTVMSRLARGRRRLASTLGVDAQEAG
jgi:RNA polymerase sigma-70 factor, ECF subfamily